MRFRIGLSEDPVVIGVDIWVGTGVGIDLTIKKVVMLVVVMGVRNEMVLALEGRLGTWDVCILGRLYLLFYAAIKFLFMT